MTHASECIAETERIKAAQVAWDAKYPHACKHCGGTGGFEYGGYDEPPGFDYCSKCIEEGRCPLCGGEIPQEVLDSEEPITHPCGYDETDIIRRPELDYCGCGEVDE